MKDTSFDFDKAQQQEKFQDVTAMSLAHIEAKKKRHEQRNYAVMLAAAGMAGGYQEGGRERPIVNWARNFCILFAFTAPIYLLVTVAMGG